jgi:hypothetical protein
MVVKHVKNRGGVSFGLFPQTNRVYVKTVTSASADEQDERQMTKGDEGAVGGQMNTGDEGAEVLAVDGKPVANLSGELLVNVAQADTWTIAAAPAVSAESQAPLTALAHVSAPQEMQVTQVDIDVTPCSDSDRDMDIYQGTSVSKITVLRFAREPTESPTYQVSFENTPGEEVSVSALMTAQVLTDALVDGKLRGGANLRGRQVRAKLSINLGGLEWVFKFSENKKKLFRSFLQGTKNSPTSGSKAILGKRRSSA